MIAPTRPVSIRATPHSVSLRTSVTLVHHDLTLGLSKNPEKRTERLSPFCPIFPYFWTPASRSLLDTGFASPCLAATEQQKLDNDRKIYENELERKLKEMIGDGQDKIKYQDILGKLRFKQGDSLFSQLFKGEEHRSEEKRYKLRARKQYQEKEGNIPYKTFERDIRPKLIDMLDYYLDACNLMLEKNNWNFSTVFYTLRCRIPVISDKPVLEILEKALDELWKEKGMMAKKTKELEVLKDVIKINKALVEYEKEISSQ